MCESDFWILQTILDGEQFLFLPLFVFRAGRMEPNDELNLLFLENGLNLSLPPSELHLFLFEIKMTIQFLGKLISSSLAKIGLPT